MLYTFILLFFGVLPVGFLWLSAPWILQRYKGSLFTIVILILAISIPWEMISVDRLWYYSPHVILGLRVLRLPVEELAFFVIDGLLVGSLALWLGQRFHVLR